MDYNCYGGRTDQAMRQRVILVAQGLGCLPQRKAFLPQEIGRLLDRRQPSTNSGQCDEYVRGAVRSMSREVREAGDTYMRAFCQYAATRLNQ
jgi:hypothetical protein